MMRFLSMVHYSRNDLPWSKTRVLLAFNAIIAYNAYMATLTIRNLDDSVKRALRLRAAEHGHSMEEEARAILRTGLDRADSPSFAKGDYNLGERIHARFVEIGGVELDIPPRVTAREPPDFSGPEFDPP